MHIQVYIVLVLLFVLVPVLCYWLFWPLMYTTFFVVVVVVVVAALSGNFVFIRFLFIFACFFPLLYLLYFFRFLLVCFLSFYRSLTLCETNKYKYRNCWYTPLTYTDLFKLKSIKRELYVLIKTVCLCLRALWLLLMSKPSLLSSFYLLVVIIKRSEKRNVLCQFYGCHVHIPIKLDD